MIKRKGDLARHKRIHTGKKAEKCGCCLYKCCIDDRHRKGYGGSVRKDRVTQHIIKIHNANSKEIVVLEDDKCVPDCRVFFSKASCRDDHLRQEQGIKSMLLDNCDHSGATDRSYTGKILSILISPPLSQPSSLFCR